MGSRFHIKKDGLSSLWDTHSGEERVAGKSSSRESPPTAMMCIVPDVRWGLEKAMALDDDQEFRCLVIFFYYVIFFSLSRYIRRSARTRFLQKLIAMSKFWWGWRHEENWHNRGFGLIGIQKSHFEREGVSQYIKMTICLRIFFFFFVK